MFKNWAHVMLLSVYLHKEMETRLILSMTTGQEDN